MLKEYVSIFNDAGGEDLIAPITPELVADGWPVVEYDTWTVEECGVIIEDVRTEFRGMWGVPIAPTGVCVAVELIRRGAYGDGWNIGITRPSAADIHALEVCGWEWDGAFAKKSGHSDRRFRGRPDRVEG